MKQIRGILSENDISIYYEKHIKLSHHQLENFVAHCYGSRSWIEEKSRNIQVEDAAEIYVLWVSNIVNPKVKRLI